MLSEETQLLKCKVGGVIKPSGSFHGTTTLAHCVVVVGIPFGPPLKRLTKKRRKTLNNFNLAPHHAIPLLK